MSNLEQMHWYSTEIEIENAGKLKEFLRDNKIKFEASECFGYIHFEIFTDEERVKVIDSFIDERC